MNLLLQDCEYLGCTVHIHHIAIHPEIHKGIPGSKYHNAKFNRKYFFVLHTITSGQLPFDESGVLLVDLSKKNNGKERR